jgi:signal transduction histidine kinase
LIAFGFVGAVYALQSSTNPWLYGIGLLSENAIYLATLLLILTFPTGRLDGRIPKLIMAVAFFAAAVPATIIVLVLPQVGAGGSISGCRDLCPENALAFTSQPSLANDLSYVYRPAAIAVALATASLLIWRLVTGTPPQRRSLAIGVPIALLFTLMQIIFLSLTFAAPHAAGVREVVQWTFVGARAALWYGFLFALIAAQLFAGRALRRLVQQSLRRPSQHELEAMLREPLGDPGLRLVFRDPRTGTWGDARGDGRWAQPPEPGSGRALAVVARDGTPAVAIVHDAQLDDDPELLQAAGAVALLAAENAELDAGWSDAVDELRQSRARIVRAGDDERRRFERNLHDGVQQRLVAIRMHLGAARDLAADDSVMVSELDAIGDGVQEALDEVREVSHGLYPPVLSEWGLAAALDHIRLGGISRLTVQAAGVGRHPAELESAVYYCCVEAIQNAIKHGGRGVRISVRVEQDDRALRFEVSDDGPGFDPSRAHPGAGLQNMRDRLGALDGQLSITSAVGHGTVASGSVPLDGAQR